MTCWAVAASLVAIAASAPAAAAPPVGLSYPEPGPDRTVAWSVPCAAECRIYDTNGDYPIIFVQGLVEGGRSDAFSAFDQAYRRATRSTLTVERSDPKEADGRLLTLGFVTAEDGFVRRAGRQQAIAFAEERDGMAVLILAIAEDVSSLGTIRRPFGTLTDGLRLHPAAWHAEREARVLAAADPITPSDEATLRAALEAVPPDSRPLFVEFKSVMGMNSYTTYERMYFPTGYMTDCTDWDPGHTRPVPEAFARDAPECDLVPWRGERGAVEVFEGGEWYAVIDDDPTVHAFEAGQRLKIGFSNVGAFGVTMGDVSAGTTSGSGLRMSPLGEIALSSWSSTTTTGSVSSNTTRRAHPLHGHYYLDGYLIAVRDQEGAISRGFVVGVGSKGALSSVSLNGRLYHDRSD